MSWTFTMDWWMWLVLWALAAHSARLVWGWLIDRLVPTPPEDRADLQRLMRGK